MTAKPRNCYQVDSPYYVFHRCKYKKNNYNNYYCRNFRTFAQNYEFGLLHSSQIEDSAESMTQSA